MQALLLFLVAPLTPSSCCANPAAAAITRPALPAQRYEKLAPFDAVDWVDGQPKVRVEGQWYLVLAIDEASVEEILVFAKEREGARWQKRFSEDLVELMTRMGHAPGSRVRLELEDAAGQRVLLEEVAMTSAKRRATWEHNNGRESRAVGSDPNARGARGAPLAPVARVEREHARRPAPAYESLATPLAAAAGPTLTRTQAEQDLDQLEWLVQHRYSYRDLTGVDVQAAFDALRAGLPEEINANEFGLRLARLVGLFGDGHTRVRGLSAAMPGPYLPVVLDEIEGTFYALSADRSSFLDPQRPILATLDGRPAEEWITSAASFGSRGTPGFERRHALRWLAAPNLVRTARGEAPEAELALGLVALPGARGADREPQPLTLELGQPPRGPAGGGAEQRATIESRTLAHEGHSLGYLAITLMDDSPENLAAAQAAMESFRDTDGLILDVRGNGGGGRGLLRHLLPYFLAEDETAAVVNVGRYRLETGQDPELAGGYLDNRKLYPAAWPGWSDAARAAIERAAAGFEPAWEPPASEPAEFSALHWCVVEPSDNPAAYRYEEPVCVLLDSGCFSATDIFLGGFAGRPGVTLIGQTSGGGSGRSQSHTLAHSGLQVRLSTMISYRPDGQLYDGRGITPDIPLARTPDELLADSPSDVQLERALDLLVEPR